MSDRETPPRLGIPIHGQGRYLSNVLLFAASNDEALQLLQRLRVDAHPEQVSEMSVDDESFDEPVYFFDLDRPNIEVHGYALRCQLFGLGGADHPALPLQAKRSHLFLTTVDPASLLVHLASDQHDQVFSVGSHSIEESFEEVLLHLLEHA